MFPFCCGDSPLVSIWLPNVLDKKYLEFDFLSLKAYCHTLLAINSKFGLWSLVKKCRQSYFFLPSLSLFVLFSNMYNFTISFHQWSEDCQTNSLQNKTCISVVIFEGETPSSYVCQGIIDFLVSNHPVARVLRQYLVFKVVPMLNPDGVVLGNYRCSLMGFDLNRHWQEPSPWAHPTLVACKKHLMDLDSDDSVHLDFYIDIHAHSTMMNGFMYGNIYDEEERFERQAVYPRLLCANAEDFSMSNTSFNKDAVKAGTGRRFLGSCLDPKTHCYTLEVSFFSYNTAVSQGMSPYTEEGYFKLGRNVARTFLDYYKLNSLVLPVKKIASKSSSHRRDSNSERKQCSSGRTDHSGQL